MVLKEKKEHLLVMAKFYQSMKDKKSMLLYLVKVKELEILDDEQMVIVPGLRV